MKRTASHTEQMHDAGLYHGPGEYRGDRLGKALEPVDHRDQDVLDAAVAQLAHHPQPELRSFGLLDPQTEDFLMARTTYADGEVHRPIADQTFVADLDP
jgi:hypothetical protein